jgi:hypothetical protein
MDIPVKNVLALLESFQESFADEVRKKAELTANNDDDCR